ncbi:MAG TPA: M48 family metalloprotease [Thermoplasmata archaeon]|nr:M48 family metalloprotease [Thermoplasmata archaeon]
MGTVGRTAALFAATAALFVLVGGLVGEYLLGSWLAGLVVALALSLVLNLVSYFACDRLVLWSTHARIVRADEAPRLARLVAELAPQFGLIAPRLAIVPTPALNAFATGRDDRHAIVAATEGILRALDDRQLRGVLAHELAHVRDRDVLLMTFVATLAGAISYAAQIALFSSFFGTGGNRNANPIVLLVAMVTAPLAALLLRLAISRTREFRADEVGARTIGDPEALATALQVLETANQRRPTPIGSPAQACLLIVNPLRGGALATLFSTHPATAERIRRLRALKTDHRYRPDVRAPSVAGAPPMRPSRA